ncbi:MAG: nitroreductase family protein [Pseudomonadales bacterium]
MTEISLHEALFTTRSMRHLKPDPVPRADLEYLIEAATMAPSAGNMQIWAFVVVTEKSQREGIAAAYRESGLAYIRDGVLAQPDLPDDRRRVYTQAMHNVEHLSEVPVIIVPCLTMPCPNDAAVASGLFGSIYPAAQNLMLAARARGLGSVLLTLATDYSPTPVAQARPVRELLDLPEEVTAAALIPIGYPRGSWGRPWREDYQQSLHWDRWQS